MKRFSIMSALLFLLVTGTVLAQTPVSTNNEDQVFATKVQELTKDKANRIEKIQELQRFIRDEIAQAKTQYG